MRRAGTARTLMSTHMEGPRTSAERSFTLEQHRKRERERKESGFQWEDEPTFNDVLSYLRKTGRKLECSALDCRPRDFEPALTSDLEQARRSGDAEKVAELRKLLLVGSREKANRSSSPRDAYMAAKELIDARESFKRSRASTNPDEVEDIQESIGKLRAVSDAILHEKTGDQAEDVTRTIEGAFQTALHSVMRERNDRVRKQALTILSKHRLVRDELYFGRLYPGRASTRNALLAPSEKPVDRN